MFESNKYFPRCNFKEFQDANRFRKIEIVFYEKKNLHIMGIKFVY